MLLLTLSQPVSKQLSHITNMDHAHTLDVQLMMILKKLKKLADANRIELPSMEKYVQVSAFRMPN